MGDVEVANSVFVTVVACSPCHGDPWARGLLLLHTR